VKEDEYCGEAKHEYIKRHEETGMWQCMKCGIFIEDEIAAWKFSQQQLSPTPSTIEKAIQEFREKFGAGQGAFRSSEHFLMCLDWLTSTLTRFAKEREEAAYEEGRMSAENQMCIHHDGIEEKARAEGRKEALDEAIEAVDNCQRNFFIEVSGHEYIDICEIYKKLRVLKEKP
jgi:ribosomal protein L37AE/L43A